MIIWKMSDPIDFTRAEARVVGTWDSSLGEFCAECGVSLRTVKRPLVIKWDYAGVVGDFTHAETTLVSARAGRLLQSRFHGFELWPARDSQADGARAHKAAGTDVEQAVFGLTITRWVHLDAERSSARLLRKCAACGRERWDVEGIEVRSSRWNKQQQRLVDVYAPREADKGLFVRRHDLQGADVFGIFEFRGDLFLTDAAKRAIEDEHLTNVRFLEVGTVL